MVTYRSILGGEKRGRSRFRSVSRRRNMRGPHFIPPYIPGCVLWLDASRITGVADGGAVATWSDESGEGNDASQATADDQPTLQTYELNEKPVVRFDGTSDFLSIDALAAIIDGTDTPFNFTVVTKRASTTNAAAVWSAGASGGSIPFHQFQFNGSTNYRWLRTDDANTNVVSTLAGIAPDTNWHIHTLSFSGTLADLHIDGKEFQGSLNTGACTFDKFSLGCLGKDTNTLFFDGDIAEVVMYDRALSDQQHRRLDKYLADKYQITLGG